MKDKTSRGVKRESRFTSSVRVSVCRFAIVADFAHFQNSIFDLLG